MSTSRAILSTVHPVDTAEGTLPGGLVVLYCDLASVGLDLAGAQALLPQAEWAELQPVARAEVRIRRIVARTVLVCVLAERLGCSPGDISLVRGPLGKPALSPDHGVGLQFNLSHSGDHAVIALSTLGSTGVDLEVLRERARLQGLAALAFGPAELQSWHDTGCELRDFYRLWTRKEAAIKAWGHSAADMRSVTLRQGGTVTWPAAVALGMPQEACVWALDLGDRGVGAVALLAHTVPNRTEKNVQKH